MRRLLFFLFLTFAFGFAIAQADSTVVANPSGVPIKWVTILTYVLGAYEILIHAVPTIGNFSIVGNIFKFLGWLSDSLNHQNK